QECLDPDLRNDHAMWMREIEPAQIQWKHPKVQKRRSRIPGREAIEDPAIFQHLRSSAQPRRNITAETQSAFSCVPCGESPSERVLPSRRQQSRHNSSNPPVSRFL